MQRWISRVATQITASTHELPRIWLAMIHDDCTEGSKGTGCVGDFLDSFIGLANP